MKYMNAVAATLILAALAAFLDLPRSFGAHPWWSVQIIWMGGAIGLIVALGYNVILRGRFGGIVFAVLGVLFLGVAKYGQTAFAASYAEDALAGKLWYFGWIGVAAGFTALSFHILLKLTRRYL